MEDYYIGLDIGTDSIGWAVTDTNYNLQKFKGNAMWGIRLLEESKTAEERRIFRSARRRTQRNKFRIQCLEKLFDKEISIIDNSFFQRLKESTLNTDDKSVDGKYSLFNDADYTDIDYHRDFATIYHLRKALLENKKPYDVRLVYIAVSHIIKNRGHFLFDSDSLGAGNMPEFSQVWVELTAWLMEYFEVQLDCCDITEIQDILKSKSMSVTKKKEALTKKFAVTKKDEPQYSLLSLLAGGTVSSATLFSDEELKNSEAAKITFSNGYDDKVSVYESTFGEQFELIERLKAVYDWALLADILNDSKYLSIAKCDVYDKHQKDLALLKDFVKKYVPEKKKLIFNVNKSGTNNYLAYSGHNSKGSVEKKCSQADFLDFLKKQLPKTNLSDEYAQMYNEIEIGTFMPKIVSKDNSVIPMQINKAELVAILKNASGYLPFLTGKDADGKTVIEKILDVFAYRIPYYVGPLNKHSDKAWLVRTDEKIYPWNFEKVVDVDASAEKFIENLTSKCTYLVNEDVLPKNSLLYSKFMVLNELNNLKIDGKEITVEQKQSIYNDLFLNRNKVTQKQIKDYFASVYGMQNVEITGIDGDFKSNLKVVRDFSNFNLTDEEKEEIIKAITIFGDDKKLLRKRIKNRFNGKLSDEEVKIICKLKYTGWGRLSRKFLSGLNSVCKKTGEVDSILGFMWSTNCNLMQLLSDDYDFLKAIEDENGSNEFTSLRKEVENLYVSPKVKRPIYQTMKIVEEIVKIKGYAPKKIFVEVARGADESLKNKSKDERRTKSRKIQLLDLYKSCKKENAELFEQLNNTEEDQFRRDALYLYYTQMGKCMYTGENIKISDIFNRNLYDIDHIFPRSKVKDDSLDNRVLVKKISNEEKGNTYPINQNIRRDRASFWSMIHSRKLISDKKYQRLMRNEPLTDNELSAFINRQLVETRQSTKAIAQLLNKRYSSEIVYVKANLVSEFRQDNDFIKCRDVNDLHHAKDAYLNIVVGNVYNTRFTHNKANFIKDLQWGRVSLNVMFYKDVENAWVVDGEHKSIDIVKKTMNKNNIRFTRYSSKQKGGLFDQMILKKGRGQVSIKANSPVSDIDKYGGYNKATCTCFAIVEFTDKKGNRLKSFVPVNLYNEAQCLANPVAYLERELQLIEKGATNLQIVVPCVKYNTLISVNGFRMHISSKSGGGRQIVCKPAAQLVLGVYEEAYIKKISEYLKKCIELKTEKPVTEHDKITANGNLKIYMAIKDKLNNTIFNVKFSKLGKALSNNEKFFSELSLYQQCCVIMEILAILHSDTRTGDLTLINEAKKSGATTISNKIIKNENIHSFKIIHQSVTGLFEQEIELLN